jgi:hypothetical protein
MRTLAELNRMFCPLCGFDPWASFFVGSDIRDFSQEVLPFENDYWESTLNQMVEDVRFGHCCLQRSRIGRSCSWPWPAIFSGGFFAKFGFPEVKVERLQAGAVQRLLD